MRVDPRVLIAAMLIAVFSDADAFAQADKREMTFGLSSKEFKAEFAKRVKAKFAPVYFSAHYTAKGQITTAAVWEKQTGVQFNLKAGLSQKETTELVKKMAADGFRLNLLTATNFGGEQYSSIWVLAPGQQIAVRYGYPLDVFMKKHKELSGKGHIIHTLTAFRDKGKTWYTAAWEKDMIFKRAFHARLTLPAFMKQHKKQVKRGYRLRQVSTYLDGRRQSVAAVWEDKRGPEQVVQANLTEPALKRTLKKMKDTGHVPLMITGMTFAGRDKYLVVWEKAEKSGKK